MPTWSGPISLKGVKGDSVPQTLPNDLTPNSVAIAPVAGDSTASALTQRNAGGTTVFSSDPAGNVACAGTLAASGALSAASAAIAGDETVGGNLSVAGTLTAGALTATGTNIGGNQTVQGNDIINGALTVKGTSSLQGKVTLGGDLTATSGNTNLAATNVTSLAASGTVSAAACVVSGTITGNGDLNLGGKLTVQKNSVFQSTAQTVGLLTCSGGMSSPNSGISVVGGTSTDTLNCSGNATVSGTANINTVTAGALTTSGNIRSNGNLSCTNGTTALGGPVNVTGAASLASSLNVTGATTLAGLTASSSSISGNETVGGTLGVTGATTLAGVNATTLATSGNATVGGTLGVTGASTVAALTSSGTVTGKNLTLTSGGGGVLTFADGTTMATAASGTGGSSSSSAGGLALDTIYMGLHNATSGNYPTAYTANNGYFTNTQVIGTTATTTGSAYVSPYAGTIYSITVFAVSASQPISVNLYKNGVSTSLTATSTTSGGGFYATSGTPISIAAGDQLQLFIKGTTANMTNSCIGWCTVLPANAASAGQATRTAVDMGGYTYNTNSAGGFSATKKFTAQAGSTTPTSNQDFTVTMPWAGSIVGYSLQQISTSGGANSIIYRKNGTNYTALNVGSGAGNFAGTHATTAYPFVAGDKIQLLTGIANGGATDVQGAIYVQWTDAAQASTGQVTSDPSFNSLTIAAVSGDTNPVLITTPSLTLTSGAGGKLTFADGTTQATAATSGTATNSRSVLDMGGNASSSQGANSPWTFNKTNYNQSGNSPAVMTNESQFKVAFPFTVTGWMYTQYWATGTQTFYLCKNRVASSNNYNSLVQVNAGNATVAGFPGNTFTGTFPKGTYNFSAGDTIGAVGQASGSGQHHANLQFIIEWL